MAEINIDGMNLVELDDLIDRCQARKAAIAQQAKSAAIEKAKLALAEAGLTLADVTGPGGRARRGTGAGAKPKDPSRATLYNKETGEWSSGIGRLPASLKAAKDAGELEKHRITESERDRLIAEGKLA